ncbi:MAG: AAA family ATPase [Armatimonadetes bacterium]|nr:AAA family ATPase [Armatimonadota bacterium]
MIESRWCAHCGVENLPHRNYCRQCGSSLELRCPGCGFSNRLGDRYCGGCGEPLLDDEGRPLGHWSPEDGLRTVTTPADAVTPSQVLAAENRLASIVKADLSGFTAMSELLGDPEEVTVIMNQVFDPLVACVRRYDGYIDNYAGDMIISFFGTPACQEDSAERAVRAALEMRDEVDRLNSRNISHGVELGISTGIATGFGLWSQVGFGANSKKTISGELGDYAALLEKYAERGTVGICPDTFERVMHVIPAEEQEARVHRPGETAELPLYFAGDPQPRLPWLQSQEQRGPLVGRQEILERLRVVWRRAEGGHGALVVLTGEPGVGKTRLLAELAAEVRKAGGAVFAASGRPLSNSLGDDVRRELRHAMLEAAEIDSNDTEARASWLASLGLPPRSPEVTDWITASAKQRPCLVVLDGADWLAEAPALLSELAGSRALVAVAARDAVDLGGYTPALTLEVPLLSPAAAAELVRGHLPSAEDGLVDALWRWSEGNPLYVRELCAQVRGGALTDPTVRTLPWRLLELSDCAVDRLPEAERGLLLVAAFVAGEDLRVDQATLGALLGGVDLATALPRLQAARLLRGEGETWEFVHRAMALACRSRLVDSVRATLRDGLRVAGERLPV